MLFWIIVCVVLLAVVVCTVVAIAMIRETQYYD
jgi:hypothetical protein